MRYKNMSFNIGDRVIVKTWESIPDDQNVFVKSGNPKMFSKKKASLSGRRGTVIDRMYSDLHSCFLYRLKLDGYEIPSACFFTDGQIDLINDGEKTPEDIGSLFSIKYQDGVVIVTMFDESGNILSNGHGHIMHNGDVGIVQAVSYAFKKLYTNMNGGSL